MFNFKASILNLLFKFEVVSDIPGRLRIKVNNFKKLPKEAVNFQSQAVEAVKRLDGVESVKFNFVIGTVLIEYDTDKIDSKAIVSWLNTIKKLALDNMDLINSLEGKDEKEVIDILFNILDANTSKGVSYLIQMGNRTFSLKGKSVSNIEGRIRIKYVGLKYIQDLYTDLIDQVGSLYYVEYVAVNSVTETILIKYDSDADVDSLEIIEAVDHIMQKFSLDVYKNYIEARNNEMNNRYDGEEMSSRKLIARLLVNGSVILATRLLGGANTPLINLPKYDKFTTLPAITSLALTSPLFRSAWDGLVEDKRPNADALTIMSIVASLMLGNSISALTIIALSDIAEFMTAYTVERTRNSIKNLLSVEQDTTWKVLEDGSLEKCSVDKLSKEDLVATHTGEKICVDGEVIDGEAIVDLSSVSGEYMPVIKKKGDKVFAGGLIKNGTITVKAEKVGDDTVISRIIDLVENSATQLQYRSMLTSSLTT